MTKTPTLSRQRLWQLKQQQSGRCRVCGQRAKSGVYCPEHKRLHAERMRESRRAKA